MVSVRNHATPLGQPEELGDVVRVQMPLRYHMLVTMEGSLSYNTRPTGFTASHPHPFIIIYQYL